MHQSRIHHPKPSAHHPPSRSPSIHQPPIHPPTDPFATPCIKVQIFSLVLRLISPHFSRHTKFDYYQFSPEFSSIKCARKHNKKKTDNDTRKKKRSNIFSGGAGRSLRDPNPCRTSAKRIQPERRSIKFSNIKFWQTLMKFLSRRSSNLRCAHLWRKLY